MQAKKEGLTVEALTQKNEAIFFKDFELLHIKKPDYPVRASNAVDQAANLNRETHRHRLRLLVHLPRRQKRLF